MQIAPTSTGKLFPAGTPRRQGSSIMSILQPGEAARQPLHPRSSTKMLNPIFGQNLLLPGCSHPHHGAGGSGPAVLAQPEGFAGKLGI